MITHLFSANRLSKGILLATTVTALAACTGNTTTSSSSAPQQQSSSSVAISSAPVSSSSIAPSSSSIASSSSMPPSSSSVAPSSSSIASSSSSANNGPASLLISTGLFEEGAEFFNVYLQTASLGSATFNGALAININSASTMSWHVQVQHPAAVEQGKAYTICYDAKAAAVRTIDVNVDTDSPDYASVMGGGETITLSTSYQTYKHTFTASRSAPAGRLTFGVGDQAINVEFDNIGFYPGSECGAAGTGQSGNGQGSGTTNITSIVPITTEGNQVLFGGKQGSLAGVSLFWSNNGWGGEKYYNADVVREVKDKWGAKLIRAALGVEAAGGYIASPASNRAKVEAVIDAAIANDMYVIIDWHSHKAEDYEPQAIQFFKDMATKYGSYDNVIYEIYNEPIESTWSGDIKPYALNVIREIRAIDPDNLIIVGTRFYSQFVNEAADDPITGYDNIAYTLHFYAATHRGDIQAKAIYALSKDGGIPLFVTEWGTSEASGAGSIDLDSTDTWMKLLYDNNISHANWALNDKAVTEMGLPESSSALKAGASANGNWSDADLTESGQYVKGNILSW